jgi:hypothetical protein
LHRNCLLQQVVEGKIGKIEVTWRQGRRRRKLLDDLKERRGYLHLKEEALDRTTWRARFGRGFGAVERQTTKWVMSTGKQKEFPWLIPSIPPSSRYVLPTIAFPQIPFTNLTIMLTRL